MDGKTLDYEKILSGIAVELAKLVWEEIKEKLKKRNNPKGRKRRNKQ